LDPLTQYPIEIWEQKTMIPGQRVFMLMFYRRARWHRGSPQMLDRNLRRFGLPPLSDAPWGPGAELSDWAEDLVEPLSQEEAVHLVEQLDAERGR
jgi:hypothetical protein